MVLIGFRLITSQIDIYHTHIATKLALVWPLTHHVCVCEQIEKWLLQRE